MLSWSGLLDELLDVNRHRPPIFLLNFNLRLLPDVCEVLLLAHRFMSSADEEDVDGVGGMPCWTGLPEGHNTDEAVF